MRSDIIGIILISKTWVKRVIHIDTMVCIFKENRPVTGRLSIWGFDGLEAKGDNRP
ncbi:hypothetical protein SAMN05421809_3667 [Natronorubrum daqingense]|uniref:Uncharacterized protein n=1 Tax=Natronorubrum daqingense TaxID=588898 RepID=A0A1N7G1M4_9EURY|nr:hypothetical protein SAMN05421809_3667 [Natronorubrum daqingense]